jgi:hypothetical protein
MRLVTLFSPLSLASRYAGALRDEPKMRAYLVGALVDDVGVAASVWIWQLMLAQLFVDQRARASLMMPALLCFLLGSVLAGPLADWPSTKRTQVPLGIWRWRTILWGRAVETLGLGVLVVTLMRGEPTIRRIMPYFLLSAFMKTALRPTRIALEVDLLRRGVPRIDEHGQTMLDEGGRPIIYKEHLISFGSLVVVCNALATLGGLMVGSYLQGGLKGRLWIVFLIDVLTNLVFLVVIWVSCRPDPSEDGRIIPDTAQEAAHRASFGKFVVTQFFGSLRDGVGYLRARQQRPLLWLLFGGMLIEVVTEFYDGKMIIKHILNGTDDQLRRSQILWSIAAIIATAALPALADRLRYLGRIFLAIMVIDGGVIVLVGHAAGIRGPAGVLPFAMMLGVDHALTQASSTLMGVAQNSASNAAMRGRIAATFAFVVLLVDLLAEGAATTFADAVGIPTMIRSLGWGQIGLMLVVGLLGGRRLWSYGLNTSGSPSSGLDAARSPNVRSNQPGVTAADEMGMPEGMP